MIRWAYSRLLVWSCTAGTYESVISQDQKGWYIDFKSSDSSVSVLLAGHLYAGGSTPTRLPLNPARDWSTVRKYERLTWDDDAGWGDLIMDVMAKLGEEGWELAGLDICSVSLASQFYILKKPIE